MTEKRKQNVVFVSDGTAITITALAESLFTQFPDVEINEVVFPFVSDTDIAKDVIRHIHYQKEQTGIQPLVFTSLTNNEIKSLFTEENIPVYDIFSTFIPSMESDLATHASSASGIMHGLGNPNSYGHRMDALNYALSHDDGLLANDLQEADVVITGVSRSGKTPTCLYLAMHYELKTANYPLADSDFESLELPEAIKKVKHKLIGLTISPEQLSDIREKRRPNSNYATLKQCAFEIRHTEELYEEQNIIYIDTTSISIEEIATKIIHALHLKIERNW